MSETTLPSPISSRQRIVLSILWGLAMLVGAVFIIPTSIFVGLAVFNGCMGANNEFRTGLGLVWLFGLWPLAILTTALAPPVLLGLGRGRAALIVFIAGILLTVCIGCAWFGVGMYAFC